MKKMKAISCFLLLIATDNCTALALSAVKPVDSLICMELNLPDSILRDPHGNGLPSVYSLPDKSSRVVGISGRTVYVVKNANESNGFIEIVRPNWQHAWIQSSILKAHTSFQCKPYEMSDGSLGFDTK